MTKMNKQERRIAITIPKRKNEEEKKENMNI